MAKHLPKIFTLARMAVEQWIEARSPRIAGAIAYYTLFSIAPLLVIAVAIAGVAFGTEAAQGNIVRQIETLMGPEGARMIEQLIENSRQASTGTLATVIGLATLLIGASAVFGELQDALNSIWGVAASEKSLWFNYLKTRFISFTMVLGIGFLLLVSLIMSAAVSALSVRIGILFPSVGSFVHIFDLLLSFALVTLLFALLYKTVPDAEILWRDVWLGAALTSTLFALGKIVIGLYLGRSGVTSTYGAAGSLVVLLIWVYYSAQIFLLGAEFTHVYATHRRGAVQPTNIAKRAPRARPAARSSAQQREGAAKLAATHRQLRERR